jgi:hypothetical protein
MFLRGLLAWRGFLDDWYAGHTLHVTNKDAGGVLWEGQR